MPHARSRLIAIGASAGGIEALKVLVRGLPARFPAAIAIVNHLSPVSEGYLPEILSKEGPVRAKNAVDREPLLPGQIYVAPPDHHLLVRPHHLTLSQGAKENRARPAIDPLFRSAAVAFGNRAIGVVLSGSLDDGTAGLAAIKGCSGIAVVQNPADARVPSMPESALRHVIVDHVVPIHAMAALLTRLVEEDPPTDLREVAAMKRDLEMELRFAAGEKPEADITELGAPSLFTCPECHGALIELHGKSPLRYRCHTGHAFTAANLVASLRENTESTLWTTIRSFQETAMLLRHVAAHSNGKRDVALAAELTRHAAQAERHAEQLRAMLTQNESPVDEAAVAVTGEAED
jgi:two-component system, chemotaxis family, protein-glutamate methylesterase/glutaminase